ncbi:ABC-F family ATP-binding cassette domain-containing protein, partial [Clostridium saudiense]|nr:ABC-F family ATP-binding cassette domain-containing protein [Clostridium saudiense]
EIDDGKLTCFKGGYSDYLNQKEEDIKVKKREYEKYIHEKARLENVIAEKEVLRDRIHKAPKGMGKSEVKTIKMGDQRGKKNIENNIKSVEKRIEHLEVKSLPKEKEKIIININEGTEVSAKNLIEVKDFTLSVGDKKLVENTSFTIKNGYKVAIIGKNGCGKTTLLNKIISNEVEGINISKSVKMGYFDQSQNILEYKKTILDNIKKDSKWDESFIRINLSEFGFKNNS